MKKKKEKKTRRKQGEGWLDPWDPHLNHHSSHPFIYKKQDYILNTETHKLLAAKFYLRANLLDKQNTEHRKPQFCVQQSSTIKQTFVTFTRLA